MTTGKRLDRRTIATVCLVAALRHPAFWRILPVFACLQWNRRRSLQWGEVLLYI
ncbi:hypothetical protein COCC4DRAFT_34332, partial [Bipolaris maydis ATCC 48331]